MSLEKRFRQRVLSHAKTLNLIDQNFPKQTSFINDPSRLKAAQCTRRAGKSSGDGRALFQAALSQPGVSCLYLGLTTESARNIMIKDIMVPLDDKLKLGCRFLETPLKTILPNRSVIYYTGVDANEKEKSKLFGQKYKRVVVDEGGAFHIDARELIYSVLKPSTIDYGGDILFTGMPTNNINSFFYEVTNGKEPGWSVHKWSALDNPYMKEKFQAEIDEMIRLNPLVVETPWFRQMYLNEWVVDLSALVYKFNEERNFVDALPITDKPWNYALGVDLGYEDDTAFSVLAWNEDIRELYGVESFKKKGMDLFEVAATITELKGKYPFWRTVIDGSNKQAVETMRKRLGLPELQAAEKQGKADFIEILNSEMIQGYVKIVKGKNEPLIKEWKELIWDPKKDRQEHSACANHCADSWLYPWRFCYNYLFKPHVPEVKLTPVEKVDTWWEDQAESVEARKSSEFWEKDWK